MPKLSAVVNKGRHVMEYPLASGAAFTEGAAVVLTAGELGECGADPALILGFALHDAGALPHTSRCLVAVAKADTTYFLEGTAAPTAANIGASFGIAKDPGGQWIVDLADVTATRVRVEDVDLSRGLFEVSIIQANRQLG